MCKKPKRLGDAELEIMQELWHADAAMTAREILEKLKAKRNWQLSTLMTSLARLCDKGFVSCDRTYRQNLYQPIIEEETYKASESKRFLQRMYGSSIQGMFTTLYQCDMLTESDIDKLRDLLDTLAGGQKK